MDMTDHNGVLMMQRLLLAGTLGLAVAQRAAAILDGNPAQALAMPTLLTGADPASGEPASAERAGNCPPAGGDPQSHDGAVLRAILDAANECLGYFDDRPPAERWCDALLHLLDLAAFAADLDSVSPDYPRDDPPDDPSLG
jgi:hypothetical protein